MSEQADKLGRQICSVRRSKPQPRGCFLSAWKQRTSQSSLFGGKGSLQGFGGYLFFFVHCGLTCFVVWGDPLRIFQCMEPVAPSLQLQALAGPGDPVVVRTPALN